MEAANTVEDHTFEDHAVEGHTVEDHTVQNIPNVGMMFDSDNELYDYFKTYAYQTGFGIRKLSTRVNEYLATTYYSLGCAKGGVYVPSTTKACQCSCHLFEFRGIICRHIVKILIEKDVKEIHPRYILSQWRKDVKHGHYSVINCYEDLMSGDSTKQFDHLCSNFYEVAHIANTREKYEYLLSCISMAKEKLNDELVWDCSGSANVITKDVHVSDSTTKLLPPLQVRSKGRPPSKRKESRVERVMKKKGKKKDEPKYQFDLNAPV